MLLITASFTYPNILYQGKCGKIHETHEHVKCGAANHPYFWIYRHNVNRTSRLLCLGFSIHNISSCVSCAFHSQIVDLVQNKIHCRLALCRCDINFVDLFIVDSLWNLAVSVCTFVVGPTQFVSFFWSLLRFFLHLSL